LIIALWKESFCFVVAFHTTLVIARKKKPRERVLVVTIKK